MWKSVSICRSVYCVRESGLCFCTWMCTHGCMLRSGSRYSMISTNIPIPCTHVCGYMHIFTVECRGFNAKVALLFHSLEYLQSVTNKQRATSNKQQATIVKDKIPLIAHYLADAILVWFRETHGLSLGVRPQESRWKVGASLHPHVRLWHFC